VLEVVTRLEALAAHQRWKEVLEVFGAALRGDETRVSNSVHGSLRTRVLEAVFEAQLGLGLLDACAETLQRFHTCAVREETIRKSNLLLDALWRQQRGRRVIGTTAIMDATVRVPAPDEVVIYYGSFPHDHRSLPCSDTVYRHAYFAADLHHDAFESDEAAWGKIGIVYVLNLCDRRDRYLDTLLELCRIQAPLDRVHHFMVEHETLIPGDHYLNGSACCATNHARIMRHFLASDHQVCLVLEDDIAFSSDSHRVREDLARFFERDYDFAVCLLAASKYHDLCAHDDLLLRSYQECTTASAYLVSRRSAPMILECFETGAIGIRQTGDVQQFAADRYWSRLMTDHPFYVFRRKMGYQKPSWSSIQATRIYNFD
jgi:hypothetical protein